jgi:hypothetical protein
MMLPTDRLSCVLVSISLFTHSFHEFGTFPAPNPRIKATILNMALTNEREYEGRVA